MQPRHIRDVCRRIAAAASAAASAAPSLEQLIYTIPSLRGELELGESPGCISAASRLHLGDIPATSRLHLGYISANLRAR